MVALDFQSMVSFIRLAGVICSLLLSVILVIGQIVKTSPKYENPKYWARPWILVSYLLEYAVVLASYHIVMVTGDGMVYTCLLQTLTTICSIALQISMVLFGFHLLLTVYDPYILSGKRQLTVWISLLGLSWIIGTITVVLLTGADGNSSTPNQSESTGLSNEMTTSGLGTIDAPTYGDDLMDTSSFNMTWSITPLSNMSYISYAGIEYEYCYIVHMYYNMVVYRISDLVLICCAGLIIPGLYKRLHRTVIRVFKRLHSPYSESQVIVTKWIQQQRILSVVFIQVELIYAICRTLCFYKPEYEYCYYIGTVADNCYLLFVCMWCFLLKDVRNSVMITIAWCKGCYSGTTDEDVTATDIVSMAAH